MFYFGKESNIKGRIVYLMNYISFKICFIKVKLEFEDL